MKDCFKRLMKEFKISKLCLKNSDKNLEKEMEWSNLWSLYLKKNKKL